MVAPLLLSSLSTALIAPSRLSRRPPSRARVVIADLSVFDEATTKTSFANEFKWQHEWYPLAFSKGTDKTVPHRLELFGEPLVLWWDHASEAWATMSDSCPHRMAPLSEGRIDESGQIECPYHGWTFTSEGACTKIPQAEEKVEPRLLARCSGVAYATVEKQGIVWVWGEPLDIGGGMSATIPDESTIPTCDAMDDERFVWIDVSRDMPYSADMLLENVLDSSHVPFTHHQTISKRENAVPLKLSLTEPVSPTGFSGEQRTAPPLPTAGGVSSAAPNQGARTERTTVFRAPTYVSNLYLDTVPLESEPTGKAHYTH